MRIDRRSLLAGLGALGLSGCAGLRLQGVPGEDAIGLLTRMDRAAEALRADPPMADALRRLRLPADALVDYLGALVFVGAVREADRELRRHPEVQRRLKQAGAHIAEGAFLMADRLESLSSESRRELQRALRRGGDAAAVEELERCLAGARVRPEDVDSLREALPDARMGLQEDLDATIEVLIAEVDAAASRGGVSRAPRRPELRLAATQEELERAEKMARAGLWMVGLAVPVLGSGLLFIDEPPLGYILTVGITLFIVGAILIWWADRLASR